MNYVEIIGMVAAFCTTISFLPQAFKTIRTRDTSGISLTMYAIFVTGTLSWLVYGIMLPSLPVIIGNLITSVFAGVILVYKIKYK